MSVAIWPPISPAELEVKKAESLERELAWLTAETLTICRELKHGLDDCYALLAPIDPGSTLVMSTPRNEKVKGTVTRIGTRIVKGTLNLQLRMMPTQAISIVAEHPIHIHLLDTLHTHLTESLELLNQILAYDGGSSNDSSSDTSNLPSPKVLASSLGLLAASLASSTSILKGPPRAAPDPGWLTRSCPPQHFSPPLGPSVSMHVGIQECCIVLWLRVLEPADTPQHFGTKLGLAIGTLRRLEHDEMDLVFSYRPGGTGDTDVRKGAAGDRSGAGSSTDPAAAVERVYVREKVRVESGDPSLISLYSKLGYLSHMLGQTRRNLAAVMGVELDE